MTAQTAAATVRESIVVEAPIDRAFSVFTDGMATWWPKDHHLVDGELAEMVVDPRPGGGITDRATNGNECRWARVLAFDPPHRFVFSWDISPRWEIETDPDRTSTVEVTFTAEGPGRTRVVLEHRDLDRHGDGWESERDAVASDGGWRVGLTAFAEVVAAA